MHTTRIAPQSSPQYALTQVSLPAAHSASLYGMRLARLKFVYGSIVLLITAAWLATAWPVSDAFWPMRRAFVMYTGLLAIGSMSAAIVLAARPVQFEPLLGGLDKYYRLHKWLGIGAAMTALAHWLAVSAPRTMAQLGWIEGPRRHRAANAAAGSDAFHALRESAADLGEWAFYLFLVLIVLALWKRVPYRHFFRAHKLMAPVYLVLVYHSVVLMGREYWTAAAGPLMALLLAAGSTAAFASMFGRIGKSRRAVGVIESLAHHRDNAVLDVSVRLDTAWPGHQAGQFAFVEFDRTEGAHPFTISSAWRGDGRLMFGIKGLGDYTRTLPEQLRVGQAVTVEGPYGRFDFRDKGRRQIWIGGGIGIAPFIAGLQQLASREPSANIDLYYSTDAPADDFIDNLRSLAQRAGVRFHLVLPQQEGRLTLDRLAREVPEWQEAEVWFCGPKAFGDAIREAMSARGFNAARFHQELFDMR